MPYGTRSQAATTSTPPTSSSSPWPTCADAARTAPFATGWSRCPTTSYVAGRSSPCSWDGAASPRETSTGWRRGSTPQRPSSATSCSAARTPGRSSISPTRPATRRQSSAGSSIPPTPAAATPPKPCVSSSGTASRTSACAGSRRTASSITTLLGASWSASACAANCTQSASHRTDPAAGWTRSATPSSKRSGRRPERPPGSASTEPSDDPVGVELLPARGWGCFREGALALHQLMHEVASCRYAAEGVGKLGVIDQPVSVEGGPVVVGTVGDPVDDVMDLAGLVQEVADPCGALVHDRTLRVTGQEAARVLVGLAEHRKHRVAELLPGDLSGARPIRRGRAATRPTGRATPQRAALLQPD